MTRSRPVLLALILSSLAAPLAAAEGAGAARLTLVGSDYPEYRTEVGTLTLPGVAPEVLERTDPQYLRLSLVDVEQVPHLPERLSVYQTVTTGVVMPVSVNLVVDAAGNATCFNPEIPYCSDFSRINPWLKEARRAIPDRTAAGDLARFLVELGISTVHHPNDFLFFRIKQKFGVEHFNFMTSIEQIYLPDHAPYRSEPEREEYERLTKKYGDRIKPMTLAEVDEGWLLHGFTYKMLKAAGDIREWKVLVRRDGTVDVKVDTLETGVGEVSWSWAP